MAFNLARHWGVLSANAAVWTAQSRIERAVCSVAMVDRRMGQDGCVGPPTAECPCHAVPQATAPGGHPLVTLPDVPPPRHGAIGVRSSPETRADRTNYSAPPPPPPPSAQSAQI